MYTEALIKFLHGFDLGSDWGSGSVLALRLGLGSGSSLMLMLPWRKMQQTGQ